MNSSYDANPGEAVFGLYVRKEDCSVIAIPRIPVCRGCMECVEEEIKRTIAEFEEHGYEYMDTLHIPHTDLSKIGKAQELSRIQDVSAIATNDAPFEELMDAITEYYLEEEERMALQRKHIGDIRNKYHSLIQ